MNVFSDITKNRITRNGAEAVCITRGGHSNLRDNRFEDNGRSGLKSTGRKTACNVLIKDDAGGNMLLAACQKISNELIEAMLELNDQDSQSGSTSSSSSNRAVPEELD
jgi:hypothetical protein